MRTFCPEGFLSKDNPINKILLNPVLLEDAILNKKILEAPVILCDSEYNLIVDLGHIKGVISKEEGAIGISTGKTKDIALISRVGKPVQFVIKSLKQDNSGSYYYELSRKTAQEACLKYIKENYTIGTVIDAKITHLESFGAFCDIGCGNIALLPIDSISVSRISHPKDRFFVGQNIKVIIKSIEDERITLSHKELLGTWEENVNNFKIGQTVSGIIRSIEDYGIFVELSPNLAGLAEPKAGVAVGQTASVYIKNIIPEKMKIKLIIIDSFYNETNNSFSYYFKENKLENWQYSPNGCKKSIVSIF